VLARALAVDPGQRFETMLDFAGALSGAFAENTEGVMIDVEIEPRLPLEPEVDQVSPARAEAGPSEPDARELVLLRTDPPVVAADLIDAYRPGPDSSTPDERSRSSISPLAFALVIGAAVGFAAGFGIGARSRAADTAGPSAAATPALASGVDATATSGAAREPTEGALARPRGDEGRLEPDQTGSLLVRSTPPGARVFVDDREYGRTPVTVGNLARGAHGVRIARDGYVADERQVTITAAQRAHSVTVRLAAVGTAPLATTASTRAVPSQPPAPPVAETRSGPLSIESRPAGAKVFIDGRFVGTTPLVLPEVDAGEHALHLDREGYQRWSSSVRIVPSERNRVAASLDR
jgi:hypothetical protein